MISVTTADKLGRIADSLMHLSVLTEAAVIGLCLLVAWALVRGLRGPLPIPGSIWFGDGVVGGVLFPVLALLLAVLARFGLQGLVPLALLHLAVPVMTSLVVIRLTVRVLHRAFPHSAFMRAVERWVSWVAWGAVVLWVTGLLPVILIELDAIQWTMGGVQVSVRKLLEGAVTAIVVLVIALWVSAALEARLLQNTSVNLSVRKMAANAVRAVLLFVGLMFALSAAGIDLTALGVLGGALGVGIGFGLQKLAANYISGFVILAERSMRIGDMVKVDNFEGRITDITTRYTVIRALTGREAIVPNEMMITQRVENNTLADPKVAMTTVVQVAYGTRLETLMPLLAEAVVQVPRVLSDPGPNVQLSNFAADGLELTIVFWIEDPENGTGAVRSGVNLAILGTLNGLNVDIPFPQRVIRHAD
jgi:small-conductance mechanosensitive channel